MQFRSQQGVWDIVIIAICKQHLGVSLTFVYVNLDEIFEKAKQYMDERAPEITRFEAACTSDIVGIDHLTHALKRAIEFIGESEYGAYVSSRNIRTLIIY